MRIGIAALLCVLAFSPVEARAEGLRWRRPDVVAMWRAADQRGLRAIATAVPDADEDWADAGTRMMAALLLVDLHPGARTVVYAMYRNDDAKLGIDEVFPDSCPPKDSRCVKAIEAQPVVDGARRGDVEAIRALLDATQHHADGSIGDILCAEMISVWERQPRRLVVEIAASHDPKLVFELSIALGLDRHERRDVKKNIKKLAALRVNGDARKLRDQVVAELQTQLVGER